MMQIISICRGYNYSQGGRGGVVTVTGSSVGLIFNF